MDRLPFNCCFCKKSFLPMTDRIIEHLEGHLREDIPVFAAEVIKVELNKTRRIDEDTRKRIMSNDRNAALLGIS